MATLYRKLVDDQTLKQHQLWCLKHRDAAKEEERVKRAVEEAHNALEARVAELRHVEAELETVRQAHYAAGDTLHAAQGELAEAALEVSRLEERIRYVVEGRQRVEQRIGELNAQNIAVGSAPRGRRGRAGASGRADRAAASARQWSKRRTPQSHAATLPAFEDAVRSAAADADAQREAVSAVQQHIQVLAADSRNLQEQAGALRTRRERLSAEFEGLKAPDPQRLADFQRQAPQLEQRHRDAEARLHELQEQMPTLDERRRAQHDEVNLQSAKQADLAARIAALRALQEKIQTEGKLKPWLAKHGLDRLQGLWTQVHIEPGWETALESALRERLSALQVGRIDTVRAFAADPPPARLAFYTVPQAATPDTHRTLPRLADLLRLGDAGLQALFSDWLEGVYTAASLDDALAASRQADPRRSDHDPRGPRGQRARGGFSRAGLRARRPAGARAGNREPRAPSARAGADRRRGQVGPGAAGGRLHRCRPAPGGAAPRSDGGARQRAPGAGGTAAPDAAGRSHHGAALAARRRVGRDRRPAAGAR